MARGLSMLRLRKLVVVLPMIVSGAGEVAACNTGDIAVGVASARVCIQPGSGQSFRDCQDKDANGKHLCPEMVVAPAGSFMMGSQASEKGRRADEGPQH